MSMLIPGSRTAFQGQRQILFYQLRTLQEIILGHVLIPNTFFLQKCSKIEHMSLKGDLIASVLFSDVRKSNG